MFSKCSNSIGAFEVEDFLGRGFYVLGDDPPAAVDLPRSHAPECVSYTRKLRVRDFAGLEAFVVADPCYEDVRIYPIHPDVVPEIVREVLAERCPEIVCYADGTLEDAVGEWVQQMRIEKGGPQMCLLDGLGVVLYHCKQLAKAPAELLDKEIS